MNLLIIGAPGTGKGTMSEKLIAEYGVVHISTGDMLRESVAANTEVGIKAKSYMNAGKLVPDEVIHDIILERLAKKDIEAGFLMDGYPRTLAQAEDLDVILKSIGKKIDKVINLELNEEILMERITGRRICPECKSVYHVKNMPPVKEGFCDRCGAALVTRKDDTAESLTERLKAYHDSTEPVIAYYAAQNLVRTIDANHSPDEVFAHIRAFLEETL